MEQEPLFQVALPIGISFYTFQALSYVIDVYSGEVPAQYNFWHMLLYISLSHSRSRGLIVKYRDIAARLQEEKETIRKICSQDNAFLLGTCGKRFPPATLARVVDEILNMVHTVSRLPVAGRNSLHDAHLL